MANESTSTLWAGANSLQTIIRRRFIEDARRQVIIANLVTVDDTGSVRALVHRVGKMPTALAPSSLTEGDDFSNSAWTPQTAVDITPGATGVLMEFTDMLDKSAPFSVMGPASQQTSARLMEELEDDIAALFTALNGGTPAGTSGANLTLAQLLDAQVTLLTNQAVGPHRAILHPRQNTDLGLAAAGYDSLSGAAVAGTQTPGVIDRLGQLGFVGQVGGVPVYQSPRVPTVNAGADRGGAMLTPDAITVARKWGVTVETDRNIAGIATQLAVHMAYGVGETADNFGIPIESDA